jgi:hypothetical protein
MSHKGLSDDVTMTRYRHCVITLTGSQLEPKVRGPAAGHPPKARKNSRCARGYASSSVPDVARLVARIRNCNGLVALVCIQAFGTQLC